MDINNIIKSKGLYIVGALILALIFNTSLTSIVFQRSNEIAYDYTTIFFICFKETSTCTYSSELKIANTGKLEISDITISIDNFPREITGRATILNLSGVDKRDRDPLVKSNIAENKRVISINSLTPNTLVNIAFQGTLPLNDRPLLKEVAVTLDADATIINGSPQGTAAGRIISNLL